MAGDRIRLEWRGEDVFRAITAATMRAMDSTLADCVVKAKEDAPVRTSILQGSIRMEPAREERRGYPVGYFGSWNVRYAAAVEFGTQPHVILPRVKKALYWEGLDHPVGGVNHPGTRPRPYLIPAATLYFWTLADRIQMEMARG